MNSHQIRISITFHYTLRDIVYVMGDRKKTLKVKDRNELMSTKINVLNKFK